MKYYALAFGMTIAVALPSVSPAIAEAPPAPRPTAPALAAPAATMFDPARHMRVSEVKVGMKGYGLSVFHGTKIERFDVEVVSILRNFNPQCDVVLIKCFGPYLEHTGAIAGMSGSPIYLHDDAGHDRMIGAFAYGWPLTKDPVAGVQPIEYMLKLPTARRDTTAGVEPSTAPAEAPEPASGRTSLRAGTTMNWSLAEAGLLPGPRRSPTPLTAIAAPQSSPTISSFAGSGDAIPRLAPLTTPIMVGGLSPRLLEQFAPIFKAYGMTALQSGGGSSGGGGAADQPVPVLEPGSVLAVPLLTGDVDLTAIGTCTEVLGNRVYGFGHPFNNEGAIALPMGSGSINSVIANLQTSFKLGAISKASGTLTTDQNVGVAGQSGGIAPTVPIEFAVSYADGSPTRIYHFQSALHPRFTPMIAGLAFSSAVTGASELPQYNTLDYEVNLEFAGGQTIHIENRAVNTSPQELFGAIGMPMIAASENPFRRVMIRKVSGKVRVSSESRDAQIMDVQVPRAKYQPGEVVKAFVTYKPFRKPEAIMPLEMELPHDLQQGTYQLVVSDAPRYFQDEQQSKPFRFTAEKVEDVFTVLRDVATIRMNAVYLRLVRQPDGVALGRTALPHLPSSRRQILLGAGRSTTTAYVSSSVKVVPTDLVLSGSAEFAITIDRSPKVAVGGPRPPAGKSETSPPTAKPEETPKPKTPASAEKPTPREPSEPRPEKPTE